MKKSVVVTCAVVVFFAWLGISEARMCDCFMGRGTGMADEHIFAGVRSLGLDAKQMDEMRTIHLRVKKEIIKKKADMQVTRIELAEILGKDPVDLRAAEAKVRQVEALRGDLRMMRIREFEEVKGKLTAEQKMKLKSRDMAMPMWGGEMMGGMPGWDGMMSGKHECGRCGMIGPDDDLGYECGPGQADEMPTMDHQHMNRIK